MGNPSKKGFNIKTDLTASHVEWLRHTRIIISYIFTESKRFLINKRPLAAVKVRWSCGAGGGHSQGDIERRRYHGDSFRKNVPSGRDPAGSALNSAEHGANVSRQCGEGGGQLSLSFHRPFAVCRWWATAPHATSPFGKLWAAVSQDRDTMTCPLRRDRRHCSLLWVRSPAI